MKKSRSQLASYLQARENVFVNDRAGMVDKWDKLVDAFCGLVDGKWKSGEGEADPKGTTKGRSLMVLSLVRQVVMRALGILTDAYLEGGKLAFKLTSDALPGELVPRADQEGLDANTRLIVEGIAAHEKLMRRELEEGNDNEVLEEASTGALLLGEAYTKYVEIEVPDEQPMLEQTDAGEVLVFDEGTKVIPARIYVPAYDLLFDRVAGFEKSDLHIHRIRLTLAELSDMRGKPGVDERELAAVIKEHRAAVSKKADEAPKQREGKADSEPVLLSEAWGLVPRACLAENWNGFDGSSGRMSSADASAPEMADMVEVRVHRIGDRILSVLPSKRRERPFDRLALEKLTETTMTGGPAAAVLPYQDLGSHVLRAIDDNVNRTSNVVFAVLDDCLKKSIVEVRADIGTIIKLDPEGITQDLKQVMQQLKVEDVTTPLFKLLLEVILPLSEQAGLIPRIDGVDAHAQTATEVREKIARAGKYLRPVLCGIDTMNEKHLGRMHRHNSRRADLPVPKIPLRVRALGFQSFQNRYERARELDAIWLQFKDDPDVGPQLKKRAHAEERYRSAGYDPDMFLMSAEDLRAAAAEQQRQLTALESNASAANDPRVQMQMEELRASVRAKNAQAEELESRRDLNRARANAATRDALIRTAETVRRMKQPEPVPTAP